MLNKEKALAYWCRKTVFKESGCIEWSGLNSHGYGVASFEGQVYRAHRFSWELFGGKLTKELNVLHRCDNPPCVNPAHLWLGSQEDNIRDAAIKGRLWKPKRKPRRSGPRKWVRGEEQGSAKLGEDDVRAIRMLSETEGIPQRKLASFFGVSQRTIGGIVHRKQWKHVL